jgi:acetamidase/formamidase
MFAILDSHIAQGDGEVIAHRARTAAHAQLDLSRLFDAQQPLAANGYTPGRPCWRTGSIRPQPAIGHAPDA